jgi:uncharacterized membrane protein
MNKARLEAFSDGVIAILITIMVLELKVPHGAKIEELQPLAPILLSYLLSFIYLAIYWVNHHHLFQAVRHVNGNILWANIHLLFWLSLVPFCTGWMGENQFAAVPVGLYGCVLLAAAVAYFILTIALVSHHGKDSTIAIALGRDFKGKISIGIYGVAILLCLLNYAGFAPFLYALVAIIWLIPDRRIERTIVREE